MMPVDIRGFTVREMTRLVDRLGYETVIALIGDRDATKYAVVPVGITQPIADVLEDCWVEHDDWRAMVEAGRIDEIVRHDDKP